MASITSESIDSITTEYNLPNIPVELIEIANTPYNAFGPTATTNKIAKIISGKARIPDKIHFPVEEIILSLVIFLAAKNPIGIAIIAAISDPAKAIKIVSIIFNVTSPDASQFGLNNFGMTTVMFLIALSMARIQSILMPRNVHT